MNAASLRLERVQKRFGLTKNSPFVLQAITVRFEQGKTYAIQGASGVGKSSLMHILATLDIPSSGTVFFNERNVTTMQASERDFFLQTAIGLLFQQPYLIKELTVFENICLPALILGKKQEVCTWAAELLAAVGMWHARTEKPAVLSGGEQQRVALARALINKPAFLLADEPTGSLDEYTGKTIVELMIRVQKEWNIGIIVSTHDAYVAAAMEERFVLVQGILEKTTVPF